MSHYSSQTTLNIWKVWLFKNSPWSGITKSVILVWCRISAIEFALVSKNFKGCPAIVIWPYLSMLYLLNVSLTHTLGEKTAQETGTRTISVCDDVSQWCTGNQVSIGSRFHYNDRKIEKVHQEMKTFILNQRGLGHECVWKWVNKAPVKQHGDRCMMLDRRACLIFESYRFCEGVISAETLSSWYFLIAKRSKAWSALWGRQRDTLNT